MKVKSESEVVQSCLTLSDPMDCSLPGSSIHGIFQARVLEWGAIAYLLKISTGHEPCPIKPSWIVHGSLRGYSFWLCKDLAPTQFSFFFASHLRRIPGRFVRIYVIIINLAILKGNLEFIQLQFIPLIAIIHPTQNVPHERNLPGAAIWIVLS